MLSTNHLEPEDSETTPLIVSANQRAPLSRRKKAERVARILGRVFNPINDMAISTAMFETFLVSSLIPHGNQIAYYFQHTHPSVYLPW